MKLDDLYKKAADEFFMLEETMRARWENEVRRDRLECMRPINMDAVSNGSPSKAIQHILTERTVHEVSEDYTGPLVRLRLGTTGKDKTEYQVTPDEAVRVLSWFHDQQWARNAENMLIEKGMLKGPTGFVREQNRPLPADPAARLRWPQGERPIETEPRAPIGGGPASLLRR